MNISLFSAMLLAVFGVGTVVAIGLLPVDLTSRHAILAVALCSASLLLVQCVVAYEIKKMIRSTRKFDG